MDLESQFDSSGDPPNGSSLEPVGKVAQKQIPLICAKVDQLLILGIYNLIPSLR